ncbi:RNA-binding cell elongation regulator Jag/EloR [Mesoaciditoga sp.]
MEKIYKGKSVSECLESALKDLGVFEEEVDYEVLQEPSKGFLGIGAKDAEIRVTLNDNYNIRLIKNFLTTLMEFYGVEYKIEVKIVRTMTVYSVKIESVEALAELIGKHGRTLSAVEHMLSVYLNKKNDHHISVFVDINDYKERKEELIRRIAENAVSKIRRGTRKVSLEPMGSRERKIVHEVLSHFDDVRSYSVGTEPYRYVVIEAVKNGVRR